MAAYEINEDEFTMECPKCNEHKPLVIVVTDEPTQGFVGFKIGDSSEPGGAYGLRCLDCDAVQRVRERDHVCERCWQKLDPDTMVWLELRWDTNLYYDPEKTDVPEDKSQGAFTFGAACARAVLKNGGELVDTGKKKRQLG